MVAPSECPFCGKKYGDAEEHCCGDMAEYEKAYKKTFNGQLDELNSAGSEFAKAIMEAAMESRESMEKLYKKIVKKIGKKQ